MDHPRYQVLTSLQDVPESLWTAILWTMLTALDGFRTDGLPQHYATMQLKAAIVQEFTRLDTLPARGTTDRP